jgi:molecular chaperone GrpE (heat shock protein)
VAIPGSPPLDTAKVEKLKADLYEQQEEVERLGAELKVAQDRQKAFNEFQESYQKLSDKIAKLKEQQEQATATSQLDQEIAVLDARMKTGYELLDAVRDFWRKKEAAEAATAKVARAEKEITLYDALAKALAPDGIPSQLIAEALEPFNQKLYLASSYLFPEYEDCPLVLTQDLEVYRSSPYACLSKSARYRAGICFQYVLATLASARLLMIDEADILDPVNRAQLIDFLLAVRQDFDNILVFATSDHADPSPVPEIQVWWLEEGRISPLMPEMEEQAA